MSTINDFFGDDSVACKTQCDVCTNLKMVEKNVETYFKLSMNAQFQRGNFISTGVVDDDLYGGGRNGIKTEYHDPNADDSEGDDSEHKAAVVKKETTSLILKELALRRGNSSIRKASAKEIVKSSKIRAADSTEVKVNGLTITIRENYHSLLVEALSQSITNCAGTDNPVNKLTRYDFEECAADMEYEIFTSNKVISLYRRGVVKLLSSVKSNTQTLHPALKTFQPRKKATLSELIKEAKTEIANKKYEHGFITAAESIESQTKTLSKSDKAHKRKPFSMKKDALTQSLLDGFCIKSDKQNSNLKDVSSDKNTDESDSDIEKDLVIDENVPSDTEKNTAECRHTEDSDTNIFGEEKANILEKCNISKKPDAEAKPNNTKKRKQVKDLFGDSSDDEFEVKKRKPNKYKCGKEEIKINQSKSIHVKEEKFDGNVKTTASSKVVDSISENKLVSKINVDCKSGSNINKELKRTTEEANLSKKNTNAKVDIAEFVVKQMSPYYKKGRIASRELFKATARHIVHHLMAINKTDEAEIKCFLDKAFSKKDLKIENDSDYKLLLNFS